MDFQENVPGVGTSAGPTGTVIDGKVLLAWKGSGTDPRVFWCVSTSLAPAADGKYSFSPQATVGTITASGRPSIATFKGTAYLALLGEADGGIYVAQYSNGIWTEKHQIVTQDGQALEAGASPVITADESSLYLAYKGKSDDLIYWASCTDGKTWAGGGQIKPAAGNTPQTPGTPAIAAKGGTIYLAYQGLEDNALWWARCNDGKTWTTPAKANGATDAGPTLVIDGNGMLWLSWKAFGSSDARIFFKTLADGVTWSRPTARYGVGTSASPHLFSTGNDSTSIMMVWKGADNDGGVYYGPMRLPAQSYDFGIPWFRIDNMRSGTVWGKTSSDTDYVSMAVKIAGQPAQKARKFVGDQTGGTVNTGLPALEVKVEDTDVVFFLYAILNSSQGTSKAFTFLENAATQVLSAYEKAAVTVADSYGIPLSLLPPRAVNSVLASSLGEELGVGAAQIATDVGLSALNVVLPGLGVVLGALVGWFADDIWSAFCPNCDGPVAFAAYAFDAGQLRDMTSKTVDGSPGLHPSIDDNPGVNSSGGCGSNSDYKVYWELNPSH